MKWGNCAGENSRKLLIEANKTQQVNHEGDKIFLDWIKSILKVKGYGSGSAEKSAQITEYLP